MVSIGLKIHKAAHSRKMRQKITGDIILSSMSDTFLTIGHPARTELRVLGSRFIARALPVAGREEALEALERIRTEMHDATHHCFAYRVGSSGSQERFSDAGEPSGTAGRPIMAALQRTGLTNILVVVTRYFGGTKLGTGRLARAYGEAASSVLGLCELEERILHVRLAVSLPHQLIGELMHLVAQYGGRITGTAFSDEAEYAVEVRSSRAEEFSAALTERTGAAARAVVVGERALPGPIASGA
jgi:uncharacterized YigZ family protein